MPHKHLWKFTDELGAVTACDLEALPAGRVLLTVTRDGEAFVSESFADKRDALARSVALFKELRRQPSS